MRHKIVIQNNSYGTQLDDNSWMHGHYIDTNYNLCLDPWKELHMHSCLNMEINNWGAQGKSYSDYKQQ